MEEIIVSPSNPRIKNVLRLKEKSSERKAQNLVVVEGGREVRMAKENNFEIKTLFVCDAVNQKRHKEIRAALTDRFPYGIYYFVEDAKIIVLAVFHLGRSPKLMQGLKA